jgi:acyl-[acyl-carrier-protein]-phospholipid O-acyltransferase/long-chain-fatty-acid--[acyl-carrier-protein] ligase
MHMDLLHTAFIRAARTRWNWFALADTTGQHLTCGRALVGALAFARLLGPRTAGQEMVGILLPASVGAAITNLALMCAGRVPVNLNFTIGQATMDAAIAQAGITTVVTSRVFLEKANLPASQAMIFLEDLRKEIGALQKVSALLMARLAPVSWLVSRFAGPGRTSASLATVVFSSGSTGMPKGVMLTHAAILANVESLARVFPMGQGDCFLGILPLFHSFGFTGTFWFPLLRGAAIAFHPNPMDAKTVGEVVEKYRVTMLIATPTFCNAYLRRCTKEQFASLNYAIVGAEKLRQSLAVEFQQKYGLPLLEGYGCTEMAPVVSVNRPDGSIPGAPHVGNKFGSVGRAIPGVSAKIADQETGVDLPAGREGLLLVDGPNVMSGYLNQPERTAEVLRDGWYVTGDIAHIDDDGFIYITDRLSRFSKVAGEMVPHMRIEEAINAAFGEVCSIVTAVPDAVKGERIVAFYTRQDVAPDALWDRLNATDLPRLWLPRRDSIVPIDAIPMLGTGKVDLRRVKELALERTARDVSRDAVPGA